MAGSVTGHFETRGDRDTFRVWFEAGKTYQVRSDSAAPLLLTIQLPDGAPFAPPIYSSNYLTFVAPVTGDYWVTAEDYGGSQVYQITATDLNDPTPGSLATTLTLGVGESRSVDAGPPYTGDDWYAVNLVAGQSYFLKSSNMVDALYLTDSTGKVLTVQDDQLHFTATESGTYYAGINVFGGGGAYTLSLEAVTDDHGETAANAGTLAIGSPSSGVWETAKDADWYAITLTAGESYRFALSTDNGRYGLTKVYDAAGNFVSALPGDASGATIFAPKVTGTYYVSASTGVDFYNPYGNWSYSLSATQLAGDLPDNILTTGVLSVGVPKVGSWLGPGDADWFAVTLAAGQSYQFAITSNYGPEVLALYDSSGNEVAHALGNPKTLLTQTVVTGGTYYLGVAVGIGGGSYVVNATTFTDDFANNSMTTGVLTVGGTATGKFEVTLDSDWFAVRLEAGKSYRFSTEPYTISQMRDAQGNVLTSSFSDDRHFSPSVTGTYYLEVLGDAGDYAVSIVQVGDDFREDMLTRGVIRNAVPGNDTDEIFTSTDDHDLFTGQGGDDRFVAGAGYDAFVGGSGIDTADFGQFASGVNVSLRTGGLSENGVLRISLGSVENVEGSSHDDAIEGNALANALYGKDGDDTLSGLGGDDTIDGGGGMDRAIFSGDRSDYRIVVEGQGYRVTDLRAGANDGSDLVRNVETLAFADREMRLAPLPGADTDFRLVAMDGFVGGVSGHGAVFGTNGFQDITVLEGPASIILDGSFARGGDVLHLPGNAGDYSASISGSNILLIADGFAIAVPIGTAGLPIVFADGVRTLVYDTGLGGVRIGAQVITEAGQITAAPDGAILPGGGDPSVAGRLILFPDSDAPVAGAGKFDVFGTNGSDEITLDAGSFVLDGSFGRGGDVIHLLDPASAFKAYVKGSNLVLTSADTTITTPIGLNITVLDFAGHSLDLRYDVEIGAIRIGGQSITATSPETADPISASAMLILAAQGFA